MIQLDYTTIGAKVIPERELTIEEKIGITSILTDGATMKITYYKGDEPVYKPVEITVKSAFLEMFENATDEELEFIAKRLADKLK